MTSSDVVLELGLELVVALEVEVDGAVAEVLEDVLDEQAAIPVARSPAAATARTLLLAIPLTVNFDPFLSVDAEFEKDCFLRVSARHPH
jgi:hypothetical protein